MGSDDAYVLDASVAVCWFLNPDPGQIVAHRVLEDVRVQPRRYVVPSLFFSEMVNVLARGSASDVLFVERGLDALLRFGVRTVPLSDRALRRMPRWACAGLGGYDATYVALAEDLGVRWLTADERAARIAKDAALTLRAWARSRRS